MDSLELFGIGIVGAIVWPINAEAAAIFYGSTKGWNSLWVGLLCGLGQSLTYSVLYFLGGSLCERWGWLKHQVEKTRIRYTQQLETSYLWLMIPASTIGLPPLIAMIVLARGFGMSFVPMMSICVLGRCVRFSVLAAFGTVLPLGNWLGLSAG